MREGVDVRGVRRIAGCISPSAAILVADDGERLVCAYNDPALDADASWLPLADVAAYDAALVDVRWPNGAAAVLDAARASGIPAVLDGDVGPRDVLLDLAARATHAIFSEPGLAQASGTTAPGEGLARVARSVRGILGVTLGPDGLLWRDGDRESRIPAPRITAVDTLAAGDVWHGAFTLGLAERLDVATAARFANAAAAIKCTRTGGRRGAPSRADVLAQMGTVQTKVYSLINIGLPYHAPALPCQPPANPAPRRRRAPSPRGAPPTARARR